MNDLITQLTEAATKKVLKKLEDDREKGKTLTGQSPDPINTSPSHTGLTGPLR